LKTNRLLAGILSLVLIAGFGTPAFAVAPNFVISDPGGGDCTSAKINGVWDGPSKTCTVSDGFIIQSFESLTVNAGVTLVLDGGPDPGNAQVNIQGNMVNNGSVIILGGSGNTDGAIIQGGTSSIVNNGSFKITGGSGVGSGLFFVSSGTLLNNCGGTMDFIGGTGPLSGRLQNNDIVISSPVSAITFTPGVGDRSGVFEGNAIIPGPECPRVVVGGEFLGVDTTSLLVAGAQANALWLLPAIAAIGIAAVVIRRIH